VWRRVEGPPSCDAAIEHPWCCEMSACEAQQTTANGTSPVVSTARRPRSRACPQRVRRLRSTGTDHHRAPICAARTRSASRAQSADRGQRSRHMLVRSGLGARQPHRGQADPVIRHASHRVRCRELLGSLPQNGPSVIDPVSHVELYVEVRHTRPAHRLGLIPRGSCSTRTAGPRRNSLGTTPGWSSLA